MIKTTSYPAQDGFYMPAEWEKHEATWLSYPHNPESWPGKLHDKVKKRFAEFAGIISNGETVHININSVQDRKELENNLPLFKHTKENIILHNNPTNDCWCRDHGPAFLVNNNKTKKALVNWEFNAWGDKYSSDLDNKIPDSIAKYTQLEQYRPRIIMEGGSIEINGNGLLITSKACLLNGNRNSNITQPEIEQYLKNYYGVNEIWWLNDGIAGDDTDGHIDDITRFGKAKLIFTAIEHNVKSVNYKPLKENCNLLKSYIQKSTTHFDLVEIPMPGELKGEFGLLPASYLNYYMCNSGVIVPVFNTKDDNIAIDLYTKYLPHKKIIPLYSADIIHGLGSWHCLSQQEPSI